MSTYRCCRDLFTYSGITTPNAAPSNNPVPNAVNDARDDSTSLSHSKGLCAQLHSYLLENATERGSMPVPNEAAPSRMAMMKTAANPAMTSRFAVKRILG